MGIRGAEWYVKHKEKIEYAIAFIVLIVIISLVLTLIARFSNSNENNTINTGKSESTTNVMKPIENFNSISVETEESVITGDELTSHQISLIDNIENFISYCNNSEIEQAYSLLSTQCKEALYPTIEDFTNLYYDKVFANEKKNVSIENWANNIYRVEIAGDFLATGKYDENDVQADYMQIIQEGEENYKLNINEFLGTEELENVASSVNQLKITGLKVSTYMDYQTYTFKIENSSEEEVLIDDRSNIDTMYLEDTNGLKYSAYTHELSDAQLRILPKTSKEITIKYYNKYSSNRKIKKIVFSKIILNNNSNQPRNYGSIEINL